MIGKCNTGGSGLGFNKPLIHVNAPIGSTIEIYFNNILLKTILSDSSIPNVDGETANYYYSVNMNGTYTIIATYLTDTSTDTVIVNTIKQYDVIMDYKGWIFKNGKGAIVALSSGHQENGSVDTSRLDYINIVRNQDGYSVTKCYTTNTFDITPWSKIVIDCEIISVYSTSDNQYNAIFCVSDNLASQPVSGNNRFTSLASRQFTQAATRKTYELDVSSITGSHYVGSFGSWATRIFNIYCDK